jgi:hypothetical protein
VIRKYDRQGTPRENADDNIGISRGTWYLDEQGNLVLVRKSSSGFEKARIAMTRNGDHITNMRSIFYDTSDHHFANMGLVPRSLDRTTKSYQWECRTNACYPNYPEE